MSSFSAFVHDLLKPTERAYKGLAIVFMVYTVGFSVCLLIVGCLTTAHLRYAASVGREKEYDPEGLIKVRLAIALKALCMASITFLLLSIFSYFLKLKYKGIEGRGPDYVEMVELGEDEDEQ